MRRLQICRVGIIQSAASFYSIDGGPVATVDIDNGDTLPDEILSALTDKSVIKKAFNVNFERVCLSVYLRRNYPDLLNFDDAVGNYIDPESWQCDMIHSRYLGMMSSLDGMGKLLRLKEKKMDEGKELIRYFCTPHEQKIVICFFTTSPTLQRNGKICGVQQT